MKVTGQQPHKPSDLTSGKTRGTDPRGQAQEKAAAGETTPAGSKTSLTLSKLKEAIRNSSDIRSDRVEAAQNKIRSGTYKVDAERLAANLITESLQEDIEQT